MTHFSGGQRPPPDGESQRAAGGEPQDAPWSSGETTGAPPSLQPEPNSAEGDVAIQGLQMEPGAPGPGAGDQDPPAWRLVFLVGRSWGVWVRVMSALTVVTMLVALLLGSIAAELAFIMAQLPMIITVLPPVAVASVVGTSVTLLSGAALGSGARAWRARGAKAPKESE